MIGRTLPPTYSPLTAGAVRAGLGASAGAEGRLTELLRERYRARDLLLTDSGTSALSLAMRVAIARPGVTPLIALPAWSCYDLATAADGAGVEVVLYDLDPATLAPAWDSFEAALRPHPAAVVVVHPFGIPVSIAEVRRRVAASGALVIEDAAQAIGAELDGLPAGAHGDLAILSFGRGKGWTGGGGGALLLGANAPSGMQFPVVDTLAPARGSIGLLVKLLVQWSVGRPALYGIPSSLPFLGLGQTTYHAAHAPRRPANATPAVLLACEPRLEGEAVARRKHAEELRRLVLTSGVGTVPAPHTGTPGWLRLPFIATPEILPRLQQSAARRLGILPGYPIPLGRLPGFGGRLRHATPTPGAELLATALHTLPTHSLMRESDVERIAEWLSRKSG